MKNRHLNLKILILLGIGLSLGGLFLAFSQGLKKPVHLFPDAATLTAASIQVRNFSFIQTNHGHNEWEIKATKAEVFEDQKSAVLKDLEVQFRLPRGLEMVFQGSEGRLDTQRHNFEIFSDNRAIEVTFNNGYRIETKSLKWSDQEQRIETPDPVRIEGPGFRIQGQGMEVWLESQEFKVLSDVRAEVF